MHVRCDHLVRMRNVNDVQGCVFADDRDGAHAALPFTVRTEVLKLDNCSAGCTIELDTRTRYAL
jgi:hypothetical protein